MDIRLYQKSVNDNEIIFFISLELTLKPKERDIESNFMQLQFCRKRILASKWLILLNKKIGPEINISCFQTTLQSIICLK